MITGVNYYENGSTSHSRIEQRMHSTTKNQKQKHHFKRHFLTAVPTKLHKNTIPYQRFSWNTKCEELSITSLSITSLSITSLSITSLSITSLSITSLSITSLSITSQLSITSLPVLIIQINWPWPWPRPRPMMSPITSSFSATFTANLDARIPRTILLKLEDKFRPKPAACSSFSEFVTYSVWSGFRPHDSGPGWAYFTYVQLQWQRDG